MGREANREAWVAYFARPKATHPITTDTVVVAASGDLAYTFGRYRVTYEPLGAERVETGGRYVAVWRHDEAGWRIAVLSAHRHDPTPAIP